MKRLISLTILFLFIAASAFAGNPFSYPKFQAIDGDGNPVSGGKLYTYEAGTTTNKTSYTDYDYSTAAANPIILDSNGEATVYLLGEYKLVLKTSADVTVWTIDNISSTASAVAGTQTYYVDATEADQGASGSGASVKDLVDAIGATKEATLVFSRSDTSDTTTYTFSTSETIPNNINLVFERGAVVSVASGRTLTVNGPVEAGPFQIFDGAGSISFGLGGMNNIYAEWMGDIDGTADDVQIEKAANSFAGSGIVDVLSKTYIIDSTISLPTGVKLRGTYTSYSGSGTIFTSNVAGAACIQIGDGSTNVSAAGVEGIRINAGTGTDGVGVYVYFGNRNDITNCSINGFSTGDGIKIAGGVSGAKPSIQNTAHDIYLSGNLYNLHLTGEDADTDSSADEGHFENIRINLTSVTNSKGIYLEKAFVNKFITVSIIDASPTTGTIGVHFEDGARTSTYAARDNVFYGLITEQISVPIQTEPLCTANAVFGFHHYNPSLTQINNDLSGGSTTIYNVAGANNLASNDYGGSTQTYINLLKNGEFERWEQSGTAAPHEWTFAGAGGTIAKDTLNKRKGASAAAITRNGANLDLYNSVDPYTHLAGRWVTASCWVRATAADRARIVLQDGVGSNSNSVYHPGDSAWRLLTTRHKVDASPSFVGLFLQLRTGDTTAQFDQCSVVEGYRAQLPYDTPLLDSERLYNTSVWNPASIADQAGETHPVTMIGAVAGDLVIVGAPYDLQGMTISGYVQATNVVELRLENQTGGAIDLGSGTWKVMVFKP